MAEDLKTPLRRLPKLTAGAIGWLALVLVVLLGVATLSLARDAVIAAWPAAARLYGLPAEDPVAGLELRNVTSSRRDDAGAAMLVVEGTIANLSSRRIEVPLLQVVVRNAARQNLTYWTFPAAVRSLEPGGTAAFRGELPDPPAGASDIAVTLAAN